MKKIVLFGELGRKFGTTHYFDVKNVSEAIRALGANFKEFRKHLIDGDKRNVGYKIYFNEHNGVKEDKEMYLPLSKHDEIRIVPLIAGSDSAPFKFFAGVVLIIVGAALEPYSLGASTAIITAGVGLMVSGVVQLLTPVPKMPKAPEREENQAGYLFNGPVNTTVQGFPVPVGYGRLVVGSAIISAGITIEDITQ